jgi:DNA-binding LacI/PurR family transcriptional regulator
MVQLLSASPVPGREQCLDATPVNGAARAYGLCVPEDLAVAGFDDIHAASLVRPSLTTVGHSASELGAKAADLLLARMSGGKGPPVEVEVGFELKKRESA